jgi:hypothetical protein
MRLFEPSKYRIVDHGSHGWGTEKLMFGFWWMAADYGFHYASEKEAKRAIDSLIEEQKWRAERNANIKKPYEYP